MQTPPDHGRHWYFLAADGDPQHKLRQIFAQIAAKEALTVQHDGVTQVIDQGEDLRCSFLFRDEQFLAGYPMLADGFGWPLKIRSIVPWPDGVQASLVAECEGTPLSLFDTQHFLNKASYNSGHEQTFIVGAIAYRLFAADDEPQPPHDAKAFLPATPEEGGQLDDIKFFTQVEAARDVDFWGVPLVAYTVTLAEPQRFPMRVDLFAHASACEKRFAPGDRISGFAWLFGAARSTL
ncbi:MAG: hypothetical protein KDA41_03295 [Planctomycetales bacterium]|nr:hypothetical protein [Planctomycetales bacterium]